MEPVSPPTPEPPSSVGPGPGVTSRSSVDANGSSRSLRRHVRPKVVRSPDNMDDTDGSSLPGAGDTGTVTVVGIIGTAMETVEHRGIAAIESAGLVAGSKRLLDLVAAKVVLPADAELTTLDPLSPAGLDNVAAAARFGRATVILASGDPGFFGIGRTIARLFPDLELVVYPAASSVAVACGRLGIPWDDALVVSAHGRPLDEAVRLVAGARKAAVLTSPENSPARLGQALAARGARASRVGVCSDLCTRDEEIVTTSLDGLASGDFPPYSVVVLESIGGAPLCGLLQDPGGAGGSPGTTLSGTSGNRTTVRASDAPRISFGLPGAQYRRGGGPVTKGEVRAVVLAKLELPAYGVFWDVGAGTGSVAIEAALLCPALAVFAVEQDSAAANEIRSEAWSRGAAVTVAEGAAPATFADLPRPDRIFVGGGGLEVLSAALKKVVPGGRAVATYASVDRAAEAGRMLGEMIQVSVSSAAALPDGTWRLVPKNPVFIAFGEVTG